MISKISFYKIQKQNNTNYFSPKSHVKAQDSDVFVRNVSFKSHLFDESYKIGRAFVTDTITGRVVEAQIRLNHQPYSIGKRLSIFFDREEAGYLTLKEVRNQIYGFSAHPLKCNFLYVEHFDTKPKVKFKHLKGMGTALVQSAIEESFNMDHKGRVGLNAVCTDGIISPIEFYFNRGFRSDNNMDHKIRDEIKRAKRENRRADFYENAEMYLPESQIKKWQKEIERFPLLIY